MRNIELFCNNKKFLYDGYELKKDNVLFEEMGEGLESRVFKIDDETVLKVYKTSNEKEKLDEDMIEELSDIETNRIVLPKEIIKTKDGEVKGYSMDYVEETETKFFDFTKEKIIRELKLLKNDLIKLGKNNVEIGDLREENTISNDESFYLIDCGDYLKKESETTIFNIRLFNEFLIDDFLSSIVFDNSRDLRTSLDKLIKIRHRLTTGEFIGDYLETVNEFVRRKIC